MSDLGQRPILNLGFYIFVSSGLNIMTLNSTLLETSSVPDYCQETNLILP